MGREEEQLLPKNSEEMLLATFLAIYIYIYIYIYKHCS